MRKLNFFLLIFFIFITFTCSRKNITEPSSSENIAPTSTPTPIFTSSFTNTFTLTPTSTSTPAPYGKIVYTSNADGDYDIYIFKFSDQSITNITQGNSGYDSDPCWLTNGYQIYFITDRSIGFGYDIYCMNEDGSNVFEKVGNSYNKYYPRKGNFGTSKHLFYTRYNSTSGKYEVCAWDNTSNKEVIILSSSGTNYQWCDYSYYLNKIVYTSDSTGYKEIYIANSDGTNTMQLTTGLYINTQPKFSLYGDKIVYSADSNYDNKGEIWIMNNDGSNKRSITYNSDNDRLPCFSPDGYWILYVKYNSSSQGDLYIKPANGTGTEIKLLGVSNTDETLPDWYMY